MTSGDHPEHDPPSTDPGRPSPARPAPPHAPDSHETEDHLAGVLGFLAEAEERKAALQAPGDAQPED